MKLKRQSLQFPLVPVICCLLAFGHAHLFPEDEGELSEIYQLNLIGLHDTDLTMNDYR